MLALVNTNGDFRQFATDSRFPATTFLLHHPSGYWRFHDCQDVVALPGDTPSTFQSLNEILGENR